MRNKIRLFVIADAPLTTVDDVVRQATALLTQSCAADQLIIGSAIFKR